MSACLDSDNLKFTHSTSLFTDDSDRPLVFSLRPGEEKYKLRPYIQHGGGTLTSKETNTSIRLVPLLTLRASPTDVSIDYIMDCVKENKLLDMNKYRIMNKGSAVTWSDSDDSADEIVSLGTSLVCGTRPRTKTNTVILTRKPKSKGWKMYTLDDEIKIINCINKYSRHSEVRGNAMWKDMERRQVIDRTWQSMKEHFLKKILPNIDSFPMSTKNLRKFQSLNSRASVASSECGMGRLQLDLSSVTSHGTTRTKFSVDDDREILHYILSSTSRIKQIKGNIVWKDMEVRLKLERTWQSMKERFLKRVLPNIGLYVVPEIHKKRLKILKDLYLSIAPQESTRLQMTSDTDSQSDSEDPLGSPVFKAPPIMRARRKIVARSAPVNSGVQMRKSAVTVIESDDEETVIELSPPSDEPATSKEVRANNVGPSSKATSEGERSQQQASLVGRRLGPARRESACQKKKSSPACEEVQPSKKVESWLQGNDFLRGENDNKSPVFNRESSERSPVLVPLASPTTSKKTATSSYPSCSGFYSEMNKTPSRDGRNEANAGADDVVPETPSVGVPSPALPHERSSSLQDPVEQRCTKYKESQRGESGCRKDANQTDESEVKNHFVVLVENEQDHLEARIEACSQKDDGSLLTTKRFASTLEKELLDGYNSQSEDAASSCLLNETSVNLRTDATDSATRAKNIVPSSTSEEIPIIVMQQQGDEALGNLSDCGSKASTPADLQANEKSENDAARFDSGSVSSDEDEFPKMPNPRERMMMKRKREKSPAESDAIMSYSQMVNENNGDSSSEEQMSDTSSMLGGNASDSENVSDRSPDDPHGSKGQCTAVKMKRKASPAKTAVTESYHGSGDDFDNSACAGCSSKTSADDEATLDANIANDRHQISVLSKFLGTSLQKTCTLLQYCKGNVQEVLKMIFDDS